MEVIGIPFSSMVKVEFNRPVGAEYWHLRVKTSGEHLAAQPGQFFHLQCPEGAAGPSYLRRPMSVYATDKSQSTVDFLYKVSGIGTAGLATLEESDSLDIFGPLGRGFVVPDQTTHALVVARGVGLATMGPLVGLLTSRNIKVTALCSFRSPDVEVGIEPFQQANATVVTVFDSAQGRVVSQEAVQGFRGSVEQSSDIANVVELIAQIDADCAIDQTYTCGSKRLANMLNQIECLQGVPGQIAVEQRMACGLGMCHACVVDVRLATDIPGEAGAPGEYRWESRRVCSEGPVFALTEIAS